MVLICLHKIMPHDDHAHAVLPSDPALRVKVLETLLVEKALLTRKHWMRSSTPMPIRLALKTAPGWLLRLGSMLSFDRIC